MNCLDCETYETALQTVSRIMGISQEQLRSHLANTNYDALYGANRCNSCFQEFLFKSVCDYFQVYDFEINFIYWFHLSRTMHPEWFLEKGILSLQEIEPFLCRDIEMLSNQLRNPPQYNYRGPTHMLSDDLCRQGPFAMLVREVAFCPDEINNHDYLSIPEYVEDMGGEIADLFRKNSKSVIVKFKAIPQWETESYLKPVVNYLYCTTNKMDLCWECNTCYDALSHSVPPEDIISVTEISEQDDVSYKGFDL